MERKNNHYELLALAKKGDFSAKDRLIEENMGLVRSCVRRFAGRGIDAEDLLQIGSIGLIKAIDKFDLSFDVQFSTYAVPMIMGEIRRFMRDDGIIKVSRNLKELSIKASAVRENLIREKGCEPKISEIAEVLGESAEEVALAFEATARPESLYQTLDDGKSEGQALIDKVESKDNCESEVLNRVLISTALKDFSPREQKIIILRYFRMKTQTQIARMLGISQVQVSRIEKKVLSALKEKIREDIG